MLFGKKSTHKGLTGTIPCELTMSTKVAFRVVACDEEDPDYPVTELNTHRYGGLVNTPLNLKPFSSFQIDHRNQLERENLPTNWTPGDTFTVDWDLSTLMRDSTPNNPPTQPSSEIQT